MVESARAGWCVCHRTQPKLPIELGSMGILYPTMSKNENLHSPQLKPPSCVNCSRLLLIVSLVPRIKLYRTKVDGLQVIGVPGLFSRGTDLGPSLSIMCLYLLLYAHIICLTSGVCLYPYSLYRYSLTVLDVRWTAILHTYINCDCCAYPAM